MRTSHTNGRLAGRSRRAKWILGALAIASLAARFYLAEIWFRFGWSKVESGWLTSNPLPPLLQFIADGHAPTRIPVYQPLARLTLDIGADPVIAHAFPLIELAIAAALASGILLRSAALFAAFVNLNIILAGFAPWRVDGPYVALELGLVLAGATASRYGARWLWTRGRQLARRWPRSEPEARRRRVVAIGSIASYRNSARYDDDRPTMQHASVDRPGLERIE